MTEEHEQFHHHTIELLASLESLTQGMLVLFAVATVIVIFHIYRNK